jgi:hypothetical protein
MKPKKEGTHPAPELMKAFGHELYEEARTYGRPPAPAQRRRPPRRRRTARAAG